MIQTMPPSLFLRVGLHENRRHDPWITPEQEYKELWPGRYNSQLCLHKIIDRVQTMQKILQLPQKIQFQATSRFFHETGVQNGICDKLQMTEILMISVVL
ncbi:MAG: hypothetical protein D9C04_07195 [Nitrosopumilus sp. B06]|nr:MAG: hypothetical protein EB828_06535 [Nitrosopumilus sp. D6]RNJ78479.1 MAG: hypothetical protein D9C04_07195 [Nitrosopumilus sp. B06]